MYFVLCILLWTPQTLVLIVYCKFPSLLNNDRKDGVFASFSFGISFDEMRIQRISWSILDTELHHHSTLAINVVPVMHVVCALNRNRAYVLRCGPEVLCAAYVILNVPLQVAGKSCATETFISILTYCENSWNHMHRYWYICGYIWNTWPIMKTWNIDSTCQLIRYQTKSVLYANF